jgi:threonine 3-dehydrogenase
MLSPKLGNAYTLLRDSNMKALVKQTAAPGLSLVEVPKPTIKPNEVLIRIKKTVICGMDRYIYD